MKETDKNTNIDKKEAKKAKKARKRGRTGRRIAQVLMCFLLTVAFVASAAGGAAAAYYKAATNTITTDTKTALKNANSLINGYITRHISYGIFYIYFLTISQLQHLFHLIKKLAK